MFCKQCGTALKDGAVFCTSCGANQTATAPNQNAEDNFDKTVGVFDKMPGAQSVETPAQPTYQAPATPSQPTYQAPASPVQPPYQAPAQPTYQAPMQQPQFQQYQNAYNPNAGNAHVGSVGFGEAIKLFFKNYANFNGRASKSEYWWAFLFNFLVSMVLGVIPIIGPILSLGLLIPGLSVGIRRLHDTGKAWYYMFMGFIPLAGFIILIVFYCQDSEGDNQWGPGPFRTPFN